VFNIRAFVSLNPARQSVENRLKMEEAPETSKSALKKAEKQAKAEKAAKQAVTVPVVGGVGGSKKTEKPKEVIIGMTVTKEENFSQWYHDLVIKAELVEYYSEVRRKLFVGLYAAYSVRH
jgi:hypothetical protein